MSFKYLRYCKNLNKVVLFKSLLVQFNEIEESVKKKPPRLNLVSVREYQHFIQMKCANNPKYNALREKIAMDIPAIRQICYSLGIAIERQSFPPASVGGPVVPIDLFNSALEDNGYSETFHVTRIDCLNKVIGSLKEAKEFAIYNLFNPLSILKFILRLPFLTGFNIEKIEDALWGKFFKLLFLLVITYSLIKLGFSHEQITTLIIK